MDAQASATVIGDILMERARQNDKWGEQNHPDGTGSHLLLLHGTEVNLDLRTGEELARIFRGKCSSNMPQEDNWRDILLEEVFEALAESDPAKLRAELIQVAAVVVQWVEKIDRVAE